MVVSTRAEVRAPVLREGRGAAGECARYTPIKLVPVAR